MNKHCYRIVFNRSRGTLMAVAETAVSRRKEGAGTPAADRTAGPAAGASRGFALRGLGWALWLALGMVGVAPAQAQIVADPGAPANQRPTLLSAPNGVPLVNIQTPSTAGVSRNAYSRFDVQANGAILNNSRTNVQTQLGGWVQGNPWLAAGGARVILNEVNSSDPSLLRGYVEVAGQRAQVVVANPAGVTCDGCGFINAGRATLTTGTPVMNGGSLDGYRVEGGVVTVGAAGLDASGADYTDLIGRAVQINAGIWTNHLKVTAGANQVDAENSNATPIAGVGAAPAFAIDVAQLGGMYAGKITLIGTEAGVGVRNAGHIGAGVGEVVVTAAGRLENSGMIVSISQVRIDGAADIVNSGKVAAGDTMSMSAVGIDNAAGGEMLAATVQLSASSVLVNRGLIDGADTRIDAGVLDNLGTGRIYGDHLSIQAATLNNDAESGAAPVIAARGRLDIGAGTVNNREHALLFSAGDMFIGGGLDANRQATGQASGLHNASATIEALGDLDIDARQVSNTNEHFSTTVATLPAQQIIEYQGAGSPNRYAPGTPDVYIYNDESDHLHTPEGNYESWSAYSYTRSTSETRVASSDPSQILSGGAMRLTADSLLNDKSRIIAGGALTGNLGSLTNTEATGTRVSTDTGTVTSYWRDHQKGRDSTGSSTAAYSPPATIQTLSLAPAVYQQDSVPAGTGLQVAAPGALPNNSLFRANPDPSGRYLIATDPRFADYRQWLSSDYLLNALSADPATLQKRLGDGFYEQKLIREQVAQLTGRRFLAGYANDEAQYQALLDNAATFARAHQLRPGVTLTAEQMAALTSDIVWLVEKDVTLADGGKAKALVPQLYLRVREGDLAPTGALIAGDSLHLDLSGDLFNAGTLAGRDVVRLTADNLANHGGTIRGTDVAAQARLDLANHGGTLAASDRLIVAAGRDLTVASTTRTQSNAQGSRTNIDRVAGLYISGGQGTLVASAGRDMNLLAAVIGNGGGASDAGGGPTVLVAGNDLKLGTVAESASNRIVWDGANRRSDATSTEVGTVIRAQGDLTLAAGNDLAARAADVQAGGALTAQAGRDIQLSAGQASVSLDEAHRHSSKGFLSKKTITTRDTLEQTSALGTTLGGQHVALQAGRDIGITGGSVIGDTGATLQAGRDVRLEAAQETRMESHFKAEKKSGVFSAGGVGFTIGSRMNSSDQQTAATAAAKSTVGSLAGDVTLLAGETYRQVGSDVIAPQGDIAIAAQRVDIVEARETSRSTMEQKSKQSGLTLAITSPVITAVQTAQQMASAAKDTSDPRMKALAAASTGLAGYNAHAALEAGQGKTVTLADGTVKDNQIPVLNDKGEVADYRDANVADKLGGIGINLSIGGSKSSSTTTQSSDTAAVSNLAAGRDIRIEAGGAGQDSDILLQGTHAQAARNLSLIAEDEVRLLAAKNTYEQHSTNQNSSASVGIGFMVGGTQTGFTIQAGVSTGRGSADGSDQTHTLTKVGAGGTAHLSSGSDTTLQGATVAAPRIVAAVGGDLLIESLQDTSSYASRQKSAGVSVSLCIPPFCVGAAPVSGSVSASNSRIESDYASVTEQSALRAGDQGFDVKVKGDTDLKGGAITSTQQAIDEQRNRFETGGTLTLADIQNQAEYTAKSASVSLGAGTSFAGKLTPQGSSAGVGKDAGKAESMTLAAISDIAGNTAARTGDAEIGIRPIFDAEKVQREITAQVVITQSFGQQASQAVGDYVQDQRKTLQEQLRNAATDKDKAAIQEKIRELNNEERVMNMLIGAVTGMGGSFAIKESLSLAAEKMRDYTIEDSKRFAGVTDGKTELNNKSGESDGLRGDSTKTGGTRVDLDILCGADNKRCATNSDGSLKLNERGQVVFLPSEADGKTLAEFLETDEGKKAAGATGGIQGWKGTLFGVAYAAGSWQDRLIEAFGGTHDVIGGTASGLYDAQGNIKRGMSGTERTTYNVWSGVAILPSAPFAAAELLPPEVWQAVAIFLRAAK